MTDAPLRVLVVDDVVTTGSTLLAGERALREHGADSVVLAAVAATPARAGTVRDASVTRLDRRRPHGVGGRREVAA